jgi:hypothetical protein
MAAEEIIDWEASRPVWYRAAWRSSARLRVLTLVLFGALFAYILFSFRQQGISNDEEVQHVYGRFLLDYYLSGFHDQTAFAYKNLYLYGGFFDLIAASVERLLPGIQIWEFRHLLSALFGFAGFVAVWKLVRHLAGERTAIVAVVLLALCGSWSGAMFTHTKDVPFGTCMAWALYYTVRVLERLPAPPRQLLLKLGIAVGCAFGLRVGAVFAIFYLGMAVVAQSFAYGAEHGGRFAYLRRSVLALTPAAVPALLLMALFWPWSVQAPENVWLAMTQFSHFAFNLDTILDGVVMKDGDVPRTYLGIYLLVRLPELLLLALAAAAAFAVVRLPRLGTGRADLRWLAVALAAIVPISYSLLARPALYNGLRHFTFLLPVLAMLGAWGLQMSWRALSARRLEIPLVLLCAALTGSQLAMLARLHPYEYLAYNHLVGGLPGAYDRWETDYWSAPMKEAIQTILAPQVVGQHNMAPHQYTVGVCAESLQAQVYLPPEFVVTSDWMKADFYLSTTHMDCDSVMHGRTMGEVRRMGVPLMVVLDRRDLHPSLRPPLR